MKNKKDMKNNYADYKSTMQKIADVEHSIGILSWDKEVNLPKAAAGIRSQQVATLSGIAHDLFTDQKLGDLLEQLSTDKTLSVAEAKNIALTLKDYRRAKKYTTEFVMRRSRLISESYHAWLKARAANDFSLFEAPLTKLVALKREEADLLGFEDHPYNALLDQYEEDATVKELDILFKDVKEQLVAYVGELKKRPQVEDQFLYKFYQKDKQWEFGLFILKEIGYNFDAGRQDVSAHPFTTSFGPTDVRVTTRIDEHNFGNMTWSCIHEGGHALYEQGLPIESYGLPTGKYISLGIHESQSRLWENNVGRSLPFWQKYYSDLQESFPGNLGKLPVNDFYQGINKITPSLIRTESDELHYHFHVLIRYEIEKALIEGSLQVSEVKEAWNSKYKAYLNMDVPNDITGILQDIHWSHGSIGYFPTYSLGSFYAAQFFQQAEKDIPDLRIQITAGNHQPLLDWLRTNVHQHGHLYTAKELCIRITGEPLNFKYFMDYARKKYDGIYEAVEQVV